jgi:hypothetical protein
VFYGGAILILLKPDIFRKILQKEADQSPKDEPLADKLLKAYAKMKLKAEKRNRKRRTGKTLWKPKLGGFVLVKCHPASDAAQGITTKFQMPYEGPYLISREISPAIFELSDTDNRVRGIFSIKHLKPYLSYENEG